MHFKDSVTIVVFNYNNERYLEDCLITLRGATNELGVKVIISDDNSTDGSREILKNESALTVNLNARNMGLLAHVDFVLRNLVDTQFALLLGSDDRLNINELQRHLSRLALNRKIGIIDASANIINEEGAKLGRNVYVSRPVLLSQGFRHLRFFAPGRIVNTDLICSWDEYHGSVHTEDSVLLNRCYIQGLSYERTSYVIVDYRKHDFSITETIAKIDKKRNALVNLLNLDSETRHLVSSTYIEFRKILENRSYSSYSKFKSWLVRLKF